MIFRMREGYVVRAIKVLYHTCMRSLQGSRGVCFFFICIIPFQNEIDPCIRIHYSCRAAGKDLAASVSFFFLIVLRIIPNSETKIIRVYIRCATVHNFPAGSENGKENVYSAESWILAADFASSFCIPTYDAILVLILQLYWYKLARVYVYFGHRIRKRPTWKAGWDLQEIKKLESHYTEVSVERTHSQIRNPAWTSFPVFY